MSPPLFEAIKERYSDWTEFLIQELTGARTAPANLLEGVSIPLAHCILTRHTSNHTTVATGLAVLVVEPCE